MTKEEILDAICLSFLDCEEITNIRAIYKILNHFGFDNFDRQNDENILCYDCVNCESCLACVGCVNCENCICCLNLNGDEDLCGSTIDINSLRDEDLTEDDEFKINRCINFVNKYLDIHYEHGCFST